MLGMLTGIPDPEPETGHGRRVVMERSLRWTRPFRTSSAPRTPHNDIEETECESRTESDFSSPRST